MLFIVIYHWNCCGKSCSMVSNVLLPTFEAFGALVAVQHAVSPLWPRGVSGWRSTSQWFAVSQKWCGGKSETPTKWWLKRLSCRFVPSTNSVTLILLCWKQFGFWLWLCFRLRLLGWKQSQYGAIHYFCFILPAVKQAMIAANSLMVLSLRFCFWFPTAKHLHLSAD